VHESHLVADLIARVEAEVDPAVSRVSRLTLRIGALSSLSPLALREGVERSSTHAWGYAPQVDIERSEEISKPGGLGVTLVSIQVED
jgi:Zn finger protein HypA/HybF involved in hydrogenase expression